MGLVAAVWSALAWLLWAPWRWWLEFRARRGLQDKERAARDALHEATSYAAWAAAARQLDELRGADQWKRTDATDLLDHRLIRERERRLLDLLTEGDARAVAKELATCLRRSLGRIGNPDLYDDHCVFGTKRIVHDYNAAVCRAIEFVSKSRSLQWKEKELFLRNTRQSYGGSALLLSGGATLGMFHLGVVKAIFEAQCLPRVISGSSIGSLIAALIGVRTDDEVVQLFKDIESETVDFGEPFETRGSALRKIKRCFEKGVIMDIRKLERVIRTFVGDVTFLEAYQRTGRIINITVSSTQPLELPLLLNYLTAPDVLVWSASCASCALPFLYEPQELMAKDVNGHVRPYHPSGIRWIDGSAGADLPMRRLSELFNVNQFIVSQVNPHMVVLLSSRAKGFLAKVKYLIRSELRHRVLQLVHLGLLPRLLSWMTPAFAQPFSGDINIVPNVQWGHLRLLLSNPTPHTLNFFVQKGYEGSFSTVEMIKDRTAIERALETAITALIDELKLAPVDSHLRRAQMTHSTAYLALTDHRADEQ